MKMAKVFRKRKNGRLRKKYYRPACIAEIERRIVTARQLYRKYRALILKDKNPIYYHSVKVSDAAHAEQMRLLHREIDRMYLLWAKGEFA